MHAFLIIVNININIRLPGLRFPPFGSDRFLLAAFQHKYRVIPLKCAPDYVWLLLLHLSAAACWGCKPVQQQVYPLLPLPLSDVQIAPTMFIT